MLALDQETDRTHRHRRQDHRHARHPRHHQLAGRRETSPMPLPSRASRPAPTTPTRRHHPDAQFDKQLVTVCVGKDLVVAKAPAGTLDRTYFWAIDKSVDDTRIEIAQGHGHLQLHDQAHARRVHQLGWTLAGKIISRPRTTGRPSPLTWPTATTAAASARSPAVRPRHPPRRVRDARLLLRLGTSRSTRASTRHHHVDKAAPPRQAAPRRQGRRHPDARPGTNRTVTVLDDQTTGAPAAGPATTTPGRSPTPTPSSNQGVSAPAPTTPTRPA